MIVTTLGTVLALTEGQRTKAEDLMLILGLIGVTVGMSAAVGRFLWKRFAVPEIRRVVAEVVEAKTSELRVNGGSSMKDHLNVLISMKDHLNVLIAGQQEMRQVVTDLAHRVTRMEDR